MILKLYLQDNLPKDLGTHAYPGRLRTKGAYVTQREMFKKLPGGFKSSQETYILLEKKRNPRKISLR